MAKKRIVLLIGYQGEGYHGSQINGNEETVEKKVCDEIGDLKYFHERNCEDYSKIGLQRSSRTDKGVSAAMLVLSMRIEKSDSLPVSLLEKELKERLPKHRIVLHQILDTTKGFDAKNRCESRSYEYFVPVSAYVHADDSEETKAARENVFKKILSQMEGTHNFHNFTLQNQLKGTSRFIKEVVVERVASNPLWNKVSIHGQSFMIHQIRKMIGLAVFSAHSLTDVSKTGDLLSLAFGKEKINIPKAPGALLLLSHSFFTNYNSRFGEVYGNIDHQATVQYKQDVLYPSICTPENVQLFQEWHAVLAKHPEEFTYLSGANTRM
ncbi:tRNA pseudouridine38-4 synthase [Nematocida displodere]|uniref:tRNA pseudouridine38-4 synthase n=1 Tax=Nematocida displodere TaxID=1805483 RepID=A0A177EGL4_9MICR|nr:tRNA pseudouridine38-4 synthase [Nematocida displodere]